jgi:hypothetical protein
VKICDECGYKVADGEKEDPSHPHLMREVDDDSDYELEKEREFLAQKESDGKKEQS